MCSRNYASVERGASAKSASLRPAGDGRGGGSPTLPALLAPALLALALLTLAVGCGGDGRGEIRVVTDPPGAAVACNGKRFEGTPLAIGRLPAGTYLLVAEKEGFRTERRSVNLAEGQRTIVELRLEPETALALIQSDPPGAEVKFDGAFRGRTPFFLTDLPLGEYRIVFERPGYLPREVVERFADRGPRLVRVDLVPNTGRLTVRSTPPGAAVLVNGAPRGTTPCEIEDVPAGDAVQVEIQRDGFEPFAETVTLAARQTREITAILRPFPTRLEVVSIPPGARVYVQNQYRGVTPLRLNDVQPGEVRLRAEMPGYETAVRTIQLRARNPVVEEFRLVKNSGKLVIITEPAGVKVFLNGEEKGETRPGANPMISEPLEVDLLPPGAYRVSLLRAGYQHPPRVVRIEANAVVDLHERMTRRFVPDTLVRIRAAAGEIVRDGMLIKVLPDGGVELQTDAGGATIIIPADEILAREPLRPRN